MDEVERKAQLKAKRAEIDRRPHRMAKNREYSSERCRNKKIITTSRRFEEHTIEELLVIAVMKCQELGLNYEDHAATFSTAFEILHRTVHVHNSGGSNSISTTQVGGCDEPSAGREEDDAE